MEHYVYPLPRIAAQMSCQVVVGWPDVEVQKTCLIHF